MARGLVALQAYIGSNRLAVMQAGNTAHAKSIDSEAERHMIRGNPTGLGCSPTIAASSFIKV